MSCCSFARLSRKKTQTPVRIVRPSGTAPPRRRHGGTEGRRLSLLLFGLGLALTEQKQRSRSRTRPASARHSVVFRHCRAARHGHGVSGAMKAHTVILTVAALCLVYFAPCARCSKNIVVVGSESSLHAALLDQAATTIQVRLVPTDFHANTVLAFTRAAPRLRATWPSQAR